MIAAAFKTVWRWPYWGLLFLALLLSPSFSLVYMGRYRLGLLYWAFEILAMGAVYYTSPDFFLMYMEPLFNPLSYLFYLPSTVHLCWIVWQEGYVPPANRWKRIGTMIGLLLLSCAIFVALLLWRETPLGYQVYRISDTSMQPAIQPEDYIRAEAFTHEHDWAVVLSEYLVNGAIALIGGYEEQEKIEWFEPLTRGEIVAFNRDIAGESQTHIRRVIAVPGDRVEVKQNQLYVNGIALRVEAEVQEEPKYYVEKALEGESYQVSLPKRECTQEGREIPERRYFVLPDNRVETWEGLCPNSYNMVEEKEMVAKVISVVKRKD